MNLPNELAVGTRLKFLDDGNEAQKGDIHTIDWLSYNTKTGNVCLSFEGLAFNYDYNPKYFKII